MTLKLGETAPDFEAETTEGTIRFHDWIAGSWAVLFSHPKDFTPICTTELGYLARLKPEFDRRDVKIIGLSVDPVDSHAEWAADIEQTQGQALNYPVIGDGDFHVSTLYGMLPAATAGDPGQRTPADNQTVRNVFVIGPDKKIKLILVAGFSDLEAARHHRPGIIVDVRRDLEWADSHIGGAIHLPLLELPGRLAEVPDGERGCIAGLGTAP